MGLQQSKTFAEKQRRRVIKERQTRFQFFCSLKIIVILLLAFYAFRLPPIGSLAHADVLVVDVTNIRDDSRSYIYNLMDSQGLSHVTYYSMGVEDFRLLPTGGYKFIVIWAHSGINDMATSEPFSRFYHVFEQLTGQVGEYHVGSRDYFSIEPGLIDGIVGRFPKTTVMLMGCNTLTEPGLAQAFLNKGASTVIGWHGLVTVPVTDMVVANLFQKLLAQGQFPEQAVSETGALLNSMGISSGLSEYGHA